MRFFYSFLILSFLIGTSPAMAENIIKTSRVNSADIAKAEKCLNSVLTLKSRFIQTAQNGQQVGGTFYLKRPGKMRFEYDPPVTDFILADGLFVYYYDGALKEQSNMPINRSLATFFLRGELQLDDDLAVTDILKKGGLMQITLVQRDDPSAGSLTLGLAEQGCALKKWHVIDAQGMRTEIALYDTQTGIVLDDRLFKYYDPEHGKTRYNR